MTSSKISTNKINWNASIFMTSLLIQKHNDEDNRSNISEQSRYIVEENDILCSYENLINNPTEVIKYP